MENYQNEIPKGLGGFVVIGLLVSSALVFSMWWPKHITKVIDTDSPTIVKSMVSEITGAKSARILYNWDAAKKSHKFEVVLNGSGGNAPDENTVKQAFEKAAHVDYALWLQNAINSPVFLINWNAKEK